MSHEPRPPDLTAVELGNRAPCVGCGLGLVACLRPGTDLRTWDGGSEGIYWRHDRKQYALVAGVEYAGTRTWEVAEEQYGPKATVYRLNMRRYMTPADGLGSTIGSVDASKDAPQAP